MDLGHSRDDHRPVVAVVGGGAGALAALHLARAARRRAGALDVVVVDPADRWARGVAFSTADEDHLLNVPAAGMSALPEDPAHFVSWLVDHAAPHEADPAAFVPRRRWGAYLDHVLSAAAEDAAGGDED